jgi:hypothetical protein
MMAHELLRQGALILTDGWSKNAGARRPSSQMRDGAGVGGGGRLAPRGLWLGPRTKPLPNSSRPPQLAASFN